MGTELRSATTPTIPHMFDWLPRRKKGCLVCPTRTGSPAPAYARHYCKLIDTGPYRRVTAGRAGKVGGGWARPLKKRGPFGESGAGRRRRGGWRLVRSHEGGRARFEKGENTPAE